MPDVTQFVNFRKCVDGSLVPSSLTIDSDGLIIPTPAESTGESIDLQNAIVAPGFLELQINGALGFHFAHCSDQETYKGNVIKLAEYLPSTGVTGFYPTVPTVSPNVFQLVLPFLSPQSPPGAASILGAHVEGPFLAPSKKGAHDAANMCIPDTTCPEAIYGKVNLENSIRILTLAPELPGSLGYIKTLSHNYDIRVSMGHSAATYEEGLEGKRAGARLITHTFNAMEPLHHREPGLAGLISDPSPPYFSIIADAIHVHPRAVAIAYRSSPSHCILITDSIELSGLPDGIHPGHAQIPFNQLKEGNKVTIEGTETLIGTCIGLDECVRNLMVWADLKIEEAVMCVTENVAAAMGLDDRGKLEPGRRGDFVVLGDDGTIKETWVMGKRVYKA